MVESVINVGREEGVFSFTIGGGEVALPRKWKVVRGRFVAFPLDYWTESSVAPSFCASCGILEKFLSKHVLDLEPFTLLLL